ncbi:signal recognition particle-docking protein FtsY [Nocardioides sp. zg-579]|uniref:Signal recognition particle receptor FtsY n=1 Tax=Nocardioides marmotae TaxID=2663857 RepID=A0A6I3JBA7_9ACTN|nr:signal recognition particle-docking protein FtsY [Nocardioides marmotae]MCR6031775.1 signal recognition particle-docking protein FtsY [Gordonia jinghuaiqii]MTB95414.1 signal recognition particle-docking protein FtsY [Nocardioides marmotae]QKE00855.1 signal recognition particle-docking protein FtsY [Nocardioides marmotae]
MDALAILILVVALVGLGLVLAVTGLIVGRRRGPKPLPNTHTDVIVKPPVEADETPVELSSPPATIEPEVELPPIEEAPALERPEGTASRLVRLRQRLASSQGALGRGLLALLSRDRLDEDTWESIEDTLLTADIGVGPTQELVERLRTRMRVEGGTGADARTVLREELLTLVDPTMDRRLQVSGADGQPGVVLVVGVNGAGKTTTVGKIARILVAEDHSVVLGAADTFRAAAVEQLATWGERVGVEVVRGPEGTDPASVAFDAVKEGVDRGVDTVIVDTAGRLQNKAGLMDELGKVKRVIEKQAPVTEVLLVLDATTGQNGMIQARVFSEVVDVSGIVLTKLDGSAKGGIVVAVQRELGVPVKLVGLGEGADDLAPFDAGAFVDALLG